MTDGANAALPKALDRFDVPEPSAGLADRIAAAAARPSTPRHDRRRMWRRGRQAVLGTLAVGLLSAGAVASGLLDRVGIQVPILTALLAPTTKPAVKPVVARPKPSAQRAQTPMPPETTIQLPQTEQAQTDLTRPLLPVERMALRAERRERREAFAAEHPVAAAMIRERVRTQLKQRAQERRQALMTPGFDPSLSGGQALSFADRAALAQAARRDRRRAEMIIDRRIQEREARIVQKNGEILPPVDPPTALGGVKPPATTDTQSPQQLLPTSPAARAARRERIRQMSPEQRAELRAILQQQRALRLDQSRLDRAQDDVSPQTSEGNSQAPR